MIDRQDHNNELFCSFFEKAREMEQNDETLEIDKINKYTKFHNVIRIPSCNIEHDNENNYMVKTDNDDTNLSIQSSNENPNFTIKKGIRDILPHKKCMICQ